MTIRKIELKEDAEKKKKRNQLIIGGILVVLMLLSTAGYAFFSKEKAEENPAETGQKAEFSGLTFYLSNYETWQTSINGIDFEFKYLPNETSNIDINSSLLDYKNKVVYFDSEDKSAEAEILKNIGRYMARYQDACLLKECGDSLPIKNCSDNLIIISEKNNTKIFKQDNCVFIEATKPELIRASDSFLYRIMGIK